MNKLYFLTRKSMSSISITFFFHICLPNKVLVNLMFPNLTSQSKNEVHGKLYLHKGEKLGKNSMTLKIINKKCFPSEEFVSVSKYSIRK